MNWLKENLAIASALAAAVMWLSGVLIHAALVQSEIEHGLEVARDDRAQLRKEEEKLETRIKIVEDHQASQSEQLVRIETRQQSMTESNQKIDRKLERVDSKIDQLIRRGN